MGFLAWYPHRVSNVCRLRLSDRIFFVTVNLQHNLPDLASGEYALALKAFEESRCRLGFLLCGYVLMPNHWHALPHPTSVGERF